MSRPGLSRTRLTRRGVPTHTESQSQNPQYVIEHYPAYLLRKTEVDDIETSTKALKQRRAKKAAEGGKERGRRQSLVYMSRRDKKSDRMKEDFYDGLTLGNMEGTGSWTVWVLALYCFPERKRSSTRADTLWG